MFAQPCLGSRPVRLPKTEATELAPEAIGTRPSHSDYNPGSLNRSPKRAFGFGQPIAYGETPELRFWAKKRAPGLPGVTNQSFDSYFPITFHNGGLGRSKKPSIQLLFPPAL